MQVGIVAGRAGPKVIGAATLEAGRVGNVHSIRLELNAHLAGVQDRLLSKRWERGGGGGWYLKLYLH